MSARALAAEPIRTGDSRRRRASRWDGNRLGNPLEAAVPGWADADRLLALGNRRLQRLAEQGRGGGRADDEREADLLGGQVRRGERGAAALDDVRIHTSRRAAGAAAALNARAFTYGCDVYFGSGEYVPGSEQSEQLLAHELGHVAQDDGSSAPVLRRQPGSGTATSSEPPVNVSVDVTALADGELLSQIDRLRTWIRDAKADDPNYEPTVMTFEDYQNERLRRVREGSAWLGEAGASAERYTLVLGPDDKLMVLAGGGEATTGQTSANPVVTKEQFDRMLDANGVPRVDAEAVAATLGSQIALPGFESRLPGVFSQPVSGQTVLQRGFSGNVAELSARMGSTRGISVIDLNALPWGPQQQRGNFPIWDLRSTLFGELAQVKSSTQAAQAGRFGVYDPGFLGIAGARRPALFAQTAQDVFPGLTPQAASDLALSQGVLMINPEDVAAYRQRIVNRVVTDPTRFQVLLDNSLASDPVRSGTRSYTSLQQILTDTSLSATERTKVLTTLGERASERVTGHGLTATELRNIQAARSGFGLGPTGATPDVIATQAWPEFLMAERAGGGLRGTAVSMGRSSARGGGAGGLIAVVVRGGVMIFDPAEHPNWERELLTTGGLGVASGATGAAVEAGVNEQLARWGIQAGFSGRGWTAGGRSLGGGVAGGIAAPIFEMGQMALSDKEYAPIDYAARGGRAATSGFISGALTAGLVGAIWGSEVPILGNVVGFVVGFVGYMLVDSVIGETVEKLIRDMGRELGEMWDAIKWAAKESPGSFFTPGFVTPYALHGGYGGLLRSPLDVVRESQARREGR